jgi:hypothetical protein
MMATERSSESYDVAVVVAGRVALGVARKRQSGKAVIAARE